MHPEGYDQVWAELPSLLFISCTRGAFAVIDAEDYPIVAGTWQSKGTGMGRRPIRAARNGKSVYMHKLLQDCPEGFQVDHKNRIGMDNRRSNLRVATRSQNMANRAPYGHTGIKGVYLEASGKYSASVCRRHLGLFSDQGQAARAFDREALRDYGEFAYLNFPEERDQRLKEIAESI